MNDARVLIVGAGVSGLYAAWLLTQRGHQDWVLLEARSVLGGRILSVPPLPSALATTQGRIDLGPSWFWPDYQPQLDGLVRQLGLVRFEQHEAGDMIVEQGPGQAPRRVRGYASSPPSMRLVGGMVALVDALFRPLPTEQVLTGHTVRSLRQVETHVEVHAENAAGQHVAWRVEHVLLALPPRLAATGLDFTPQLPPELAAKWHGTDTWMAPHAKYVAVYEQPFWQSDGLSGEARSGAGPMAEIHDASLPGGPAALFGFVGVPAHVRQGVPSEQLRRHCRAQLARLFGPKALEPEVDFLKDWALDPWTATPRDWRSTGHHPIAPPTSADSGPWAQRLTGIGSEWSGSFAGYIAGALDAATLGASAVDLKSCGPQSLSSPFVSGAEDG